MKVYVIFREGWDDFCYDDQDYSSDVYGVFTDKDKAIEAVKELNDKESYEEKGVGDSGFDCSRGVNYYISSCETNVIGEVWEEYNDEDE